MKNELQRKTKSDSKIGFIVYPFLFLLLGSLIFYIAFKPIFKPAINVINIAFSGDVPDFDVEPRDIYVEDAPVPEENDTIHVAKADLPQKGERFGQIAISSAGIDAPLYYGDSEKELLKGIGCYTGTYVPGSGRTVLLAGHNNGFFSTLGDAGVGDEIHIKTNYGKYVYEITDSQVALDTNTAAYDLNKREDNLILYTCYPFDALGLTRNRYFVYAKYISGPQLDLAY
jgi:sortase A